MRGFHMYVQLLVTRSVRDTQCGFKLFTRATAKLLFSHLHLFRWAFDTEIIYLAERLHIPLKEVYYDCALCGFILLYLHVY